MKKTKFFLLGLAALAMTACNKDNEAEPIVETDATVSFIIKAGSPQRETEPNSLLDSDAKITKLTAMVYAGQVQEGIKTVEDADNVLKVEGIKCKSGANKVLVVVANYDKNAGGDAIDFTGKTLDQVKAMTIQLTQDNQSAKFLIMTGESNAFTIKPGTNYYGYPAGTGTTQDNLIETGNALKVTRVHAAMSIQNVTVTFDPQYSSNYYFKPQNVAGLICKKQSKIFGASLDFGTDYLGGVATTAAAYTPTTSYDNNVSWLTKPYAAKAGFYIMESVYQVGNNLRPTILCVYGKLKKTETQDFSQEELDAAMAAGYCDSNAITYYPVLVNYNGYGYTYTGENTGLNKILRNNHYKISLTVKGPGTNTPEGPLPEEANLNVNCEVVSWNVVNQNAIWN